MPEDQAESTEEDAEIGEGLTALCRAIGSIALAGAEIELSA